MPRFMDIHEGFVGVSKEQFQEAHQRDLEIQAQEGVSYDQAWLDPSSGIAFCLVTGPDLDAVVRVHQRAGHPATKVVQLAYEV